MSVTAITPGSKYRSCSNDEKFLVPKDSAENEVMITILVNESSLLCKTKSTIAARISAFNKACLEFKKVFVKQN